MWLSAEAGVLACSDYDTGAPLPTSSAGRTIGAYAHLRVRVTFLPREVRVRVCVSCGCACVVCVCVCVSVCVRVCFIRCIDRALTG